ncbi:uncharacterized protein [Epargyreus clarus]|uniref:uncharacterized protein n=2 Tax=Epargyreus clarus TaxID=520877 RepID=UPI003C302D7C
MQNISISSSSDANTCSQYNNSQCGNLLKCQLCSQPRYFKGNRGLRVHFGKAHKNVEHVESTEITQTEASSDFVKTLGRLKGSIPVVKRIPRGSRVTVATTLNTIIKDVVNKNDLQSWEHLLTFPYVVLHAKKDSRSSLTQIIKTNCTSLIKYNDIVIKSKTSHKNSNIFKKVEQKVTDGDLKGAATILFSNDVIAPDSPATLSALLEKHPPASIHGSPEFLNIEDDPLQITPKQVLAAVMCFKNGSAGGLDGLTPQHLKDLVGGHVGDAGQLLLNSITQLINIMLAGKVTSDVTHILYGANICALKKKDGGIRPIAVGCTLRRLASKICCNVIKPNISEKLSPVQLGFGSQGGCEAAVHAARTLLMKERGDVFLKLDIKNAFNSVDRITLLDQVKQVTPSIYPFLWQCYGTPSKLVYKHHLLNSSVGCQQGDPLGPAIFSLAIHPIVSNLNSKFNVWYLDDGSLGGDTETVFTDFQEIMDKFSNIGLEVNFSKCELFVSNSKNVNEKNSIIERFKTLAPNIKISDKHSLHLLGSPIFPESIPSFIENNIHNFNETSDRLLKINSHMALFIIRFCLFVPKFTYLLRSTPLWKFNELCLKLDDIIMKTLSSVLNCHMNERAWTQASLPVRHGGLGIRKISSVALPAFLSSVHKTQNLTSDILSKIFEEPQITFMDEAKDAWLQAGPNLKFPVHLNLQKLWDEPLCILVRHQLLDSAHDIAERARLLAVAERESGFWLQAYPSGNIGTLLDNLTLSVCTRLRLGVKTVEHHRCHCGADVDVFGHHGLSCQRSAGRLSRHATINDVIRRAFVTVNVPACLEPNGLARDDGKRPDGMTLIPWKGGRMLVWDATCVDTLAPSHLQASSSGAGAAATAAENAKRHKYVSLCNNYIFVAFGVETLGPWGPDAWQLYKQLSTRLVDVSGDPGAGTHFAQRIAIAIQRGNAASILGTLPKDSDGDHFLW